MAEMTLVPIGKLVPNKWNPNRMDGETFEGLKSSIEHANLLEKNPILVRPKDKGYEIVDGEQRWRAAKALGLKKVPVEIDEMDDVEAKQRTVILNKDRGAIDYFPLGKIFYELSSDGGGTLTQEKIGVLFGGYSQPVVSAIANVYARLKAFPIKSIGLLSNYDKRTIATVLCDKFREVLFNARIKSIETKGREGVKSLGIDKKASLLNDLWRYIQEKTEDEAVRGDLVETLMGDKSSLLAASFSKLKNDVDVAYEELVEKSIIHGDALVEMDKFEDGVFDCVITDPPYLVSTKEGEITFKERKDMKRDLAEWDYMERGEFLDWCKEWMEKSYRVLKDGGAIYIFTSDRFLSHFIELLEGVGFTAKTSIVWHKTNPEPQVRQREYVSSTEYIVFAVKGDGYTFNWLGQNEMHNLVENPICMGGERTVHPTQKPVAVVKKLLEVSTNTKDRVLDPFAGSGTTAVACNELKRSWTMIEKEKEYVDLIKRRVL